MDPITDLRLLNHARVDYGPQIDTSAKPGRPRTGAPRYIVSILVIALAGWAIR